MDDHQYADRPRDADGGTEAVRQRGSVAHEPGRSNTRLPAVVAVDFLCAVEFAGDSEFIAGLTRVESFAARKLRL